MRFNKALAVGATIFSIVEALPGRASNFATREVSGSELRDEYDFVIVGGGTAGLTIAHRVSAAFPRSKSS